MKKYDQGHENGHDEIDAIHAAMQSCLARLRLSVISRQDSASICNIINELCDLCSVHDQAEWEFFASHGHDHEFDHGFVFVFLDHLYEMVKSHAGTKEITDIMTAIQGIITADMILDRIDFRKLCEHRNKLHRSEKIFRLMSRRSTALGSM